MDKINIYGYEVYDMYEALKCLRSCFGDKPWDMWLEENHYGPVICIEGIYDSDGLSVVLSSLEEVEDFIKSEENF